MSTHGKFVWHDLMTTDVKGSHRFYSQLFGWTTTDVVAEQTPYLHLKAGDREIGGMMPFHKQGVPTHWIGYVSVASVDEAVKKATARGAKTYAPAQDIEVGRFAVLADPAGAIFSPFQYTKEKAQPAQAKPAPGTFCWDELYVPDTESAKAFYHDVFGWGAEGMDMGALGTYWLFNSEGENAGGMMKMMPGQPFPHWLPYVAVADADRTAASARELGAQVVVPPTDIPNVGRFAVFVDPQHAALGILRGIA